MVHVARQAILDARGHVAGYELLYRGSVRDTACTVEGDVAGASVLSGAMLDLRLDAITDGRTPFINVTRSMLLNGVATLLRPSAAVFELLESIWRSTTSRRARPPRRCCRLRATSKWTCWSPPAARSPISCAGSRPGA
jgi:c-di-GMP-related signal transduction protein